MGRRNREGDTGGRRMNMAGRPRQLNALTLAQKEGGNRAGCSREKLLGNRGEPRRKPRGQMGRSDRAALLEAVGHGQLRLRGRRLNARRGSRLLGGGRGTSGHLEE